MDIAAAVVVVGVVITVPAAGVVARAALPHLRIYCDPHNSHLDRHSCNSSLASKVLWFPISVVQLRRCQRIRAHLDGSLLDEPPPSG